MVTWTRSRTSKNEGNFMVIGDDSTRWRSEGLKTEGREKKTEKF